MRLICVPLLLFGLLAATCTGNGGDGSVDEDEYLEQFAQLTQLTTPMSPPGEDAGRILDARLDLMERMEPPAGLEVEHAAAAKAWPRLHELVTIYQQGEESVRSDPALLSELDELSTVIERWNEAVKDYFGVWIGNATGSSMEPALCDGAIVVATAVDDDTEIKRWSIIVFEYPEDTERDFTKRVVGLPGEAISVVAGGQILIDGTPVADDIYALMPANYTVEPLVIPPGRYYVLGDNRRNSFDSHAWGLGAASNLTEAEAATVPRDHILGVLPADTVDCPKENTPEADG